MAATWRRRGGESVRDAARRRAIRLAHRRVGQRGTSDRAFGGGELGTADPGQLVCCEHTRRGGGCAASTRTAPWWTAQLAATARSRCGVAVAHADGIDLDLPLGAGNQHLIADGDALTFRERLCRTSRVDAGQLPAEQRQRTV
ncbi:hypothetical protein [Qaidamihabitans albus]|uniref:hypothetical protein n=1 Tax=Qaidamihabitans albus TaxID=2795733 RepID=UPI0018F1C133|nr:hypothetical protein [Qaidamihabitans albus]